MMSRCRCDSLAEPVPQIGDRRRRSDVADRSGHIVALRQNRSEMRTLLLPLSAVGEPQCQMDKIPALLQRIGGVSSACLFFNQTALRIYYYPEQTNVINIVEELQTLALSLRDYRQLEDDLPCASVCG